MSVTAVVGYNRWHIKQLGLLRDCSTADFIALYDTVTAGKTTNSFHYPFYIAVNNNISSDLSFTGADQNINSIHLMDLKLTLLMILPTTRNHRQNRESLYLSLKT